MAFGSTLIIDGKAITAPAFTPSAGYGRALAHTVENTERRLLYCWLWGIDSISFWFFPARIEGGHLDGFAWTNGHWAKMRLRAGQVKDYFC